MYDIISKYTSALFRNATLGFYNIKTAKIKEMVNVELPDVKVRAKSTDIVFLLEDGSYLHLEFQTVYSKADLMRFAVYDVLLYERDGKKIYTVIIYSSQVSAADVKLDTGSLKFEPQTVFFKDYDGDATYADLETKLKTGQELTDIDMLNLIFLPLMKTTKPKDELAEKSVEIAKSIPDETKRNACIASIFAFASKFLEEDTLNKLLEAIKVSELATMLVTEKAVEIAKKLLDKGLSINDVAEATGLDLITVEELKDKLDSEKANAENGESDS